jgi:hypothetical protein
MEQKYLITSQIDKNIHSYCGRMKQCNYRIAFNFEGNVKWFDVLIETKIMGIDINQYMELPAGKIKVSLQDNPDSRDISIGKRFINTGRAWEVIGIDKSNKGIIMLTCDLVCTSTNDDLINEIAERYLYEVVHTYVLNIGNGNAANLSLNRTVQLNISVTDNGGVMTTIPDLTYLSSDPDIVAVDNTGKLMGINTGTAIITCQMAYRSEVKAMINITVTEMVSHQYTINVSGSTIVKLGQRKSYVANSYDNGIEIFDKSVAWTIRNQDGTDTPAYATITASTGNGVTVKASDVPAHILKYVVLRATLSDDASVFKEITIQIKSLI